jgi:general stress protein 26
MRLIGLVAILAPSLVLGQSAPAQPSRAAIIAGAKDVIAKARYATLVSIDDTGSPQARIVDPMSPGADLTIWIATNPLTRKVEQIRKNPKISLLYFDAGTSSYVTIIGTGEVVTSAAEKARHWKDDLAPFYENRNHGADYALVKLTPRRLEIVSVSRGLVGDPKTWRPIVLDFP